jgi:hypothetical protein
MESRRIIMESAGKRPDGLNAKITDLVTWLKHLRHSTESGVEI